MGFGVWGDHASNLSAEFNFSDLRGDKQAKGPQLHGEKATSE